jgi:murein DD-endopeptidase MepM/ murein hydrolase activator NlpD
VAVLTVAIVGIALSNIDWPARAATTLSASAALPAVGSKQQSESGESQVVVTSRNTSARSKVGQTSDAIFRQAQPHTIIPERPRLDIVTYTIQAGDTVQSIATQFGLEPTTIMWANPPIEDAPDLLRIGQEVIILPIDGVYHQVEEGDTLASIAEKYQVEPDAIVGCTYNGLESRRSAIAPGDYLIVPGGEKPYEPRAVTAYAGPVPQGARGTGRFQWPVLGRITQGYWYGHRAIDIGAPAGSAVVATDGGFISFAGWTDVGYGYLIVVDHANGFATYYAHLSNIYVIEGQAVDRGKVIGAVGNTGNSTGPHLHFEVRRHDTQQNPRAYLP